MDEPQSMDAAQQVQCEITGKWVPPDEIVEFHGHKVCAEGKEILLQRLQSGERLPGEMERPTVLRRFSCLFVDSIVIAIPMWIMIAVVGVPKANSDNLAVSSMMLLPTILGVILGMCYYGIMHGIRGQTLGKMAGKIKVVNLDGSPITMGTAFARAIFYMGPQIIFPILALVGAVTLAGVLYWVVLSYGLANILVALFDRSRQRALHDRFVGTRVLVLN